MFGRLNCRFGRHTWGPWEPDVDVPCLTIRFCEYCHLKETGISRHSFTPWTRASQDEQCLEMRNCARCGQKETRPALHNWEAWHYEGDDTCTQVRTCLDCTRTEYRVAEHLWSQDSSAPENGVMQRICKRCGRVEDETQVFSPSPVESQHISVVEAELLAVADEASIPLPEFIDVESQTVSQVSIEPLAEPNTLIESRDAVSSAEKPRKRKRKTKEIKPVLETFDAAEVVEDSMPEVTSRALLIVPQPPVTTETTPPSTSRKRKGIKNTEQTSSAPDCEAHDLVWAVVANQPCLREYKCQRCGHVAESQENHKWFLTYRSERGTEHYTCEDCHKTMVRN